MDGTPSATSRLSLPWCELTGRIAVGVPPLMIGLALLALEVPNLIFRVAPLAIHGTMASMGVLLFAIGLLCLQGRFFLPCLYLLVSLAVAVIPSFIPGFSAFGPTPPLLSWTVALLTVSFLWVLIRSLGKWVQGTQLLPACSLLLALLFAMQVPDTSRAFGSLLSQAVVPRDPSPPYSAGDAVGVLRFELPDGSSVSTAEADTVYVINFWASWCAPCLAELPELQKLQHTMSPYNDVRILAINTEDKPKTATVEFLETRGIHGIPLAFDSEHVYRRLGSRVLPTTVILKNNRIFAIVVGFHPSLAADLRMRIEAARKSDRPTVGRSEPATSS